MATETYSVNGRQVSTHDKDALADYRDKWSRDEDVTEIDMDTHVVPQYAKHFPAAGEYPDEVYANTDCLSVEQVRSDLSRGDTVLYWTSPPCNPNAYLNTGTVKQRPPVPYTPTIGEPEEPSADHFVVTHGSFDNRRNSLFGDMIEKVRVDCVVAINPEAAND